ncbi:RagB/SusD family nutrient uptake outer membrane protein [Mariniphaga sediminis]|uniref:RagB/SusD family nutrient uptake outer membrane protein n=1 Tax=Mariniphaga sediminis TaxID=1628158 RepID=UPI0035634622
MKKKFIYIYISAMLIISMSCKEDFLQRDEGVAIDLEKIFSDPVLATKFGDESYNYLWNDFATINVNPPNNRVSSGNTRVNFYFSDECMETHNNSQQALFIMRGIYLEDNTLSSSYKYTEIGGSWQRAYEGIRNTSRMLEEMDKVPWGPEDYPDRIKGEQHFIRAFMYFELIKRFGGVPIIPNVLSLSDNADLPRNTYEECVDYILDDLAEAENVLPLVYDENAYGRITKGAVKALRSRVLLYAASFRDNPAGDLSKWAAAATAAKDLMDNMSYLYPLESSHVNILKYTIKDEFILCMPKPVRNDNLMFLIQLTTPNRGGSGFGNCVPTQDHVDLYEMANGKLITDPTSGYDPQNPYINRDPRFYENILYNGAEWGPRPIETWEAEDGVTLGRDAKAAASFQAAYFVRKLWPVEKQLGGSSQYVHFPIFRMAEILLNYAEAQNEAVGPDESVYDAVNQIRNRAQMPDLPNGLSQAQMRERIRNERAVELAFETNRWFDIMRWGIGKDILNGTTRSMRIVKLNDDSYRYEPIDMPSGFNRTFLERQNFYPIPLGEIQKSNGILKQNPGWEIN